MAGTDDMSESKALLSEAEIDRIARVAAEKFLDIKPEANGTASAAHTSASMAVPVVGPTDCLELDRGQAVTIADFKFGGSACLNGVPIFQI